MSDDELVRRYLLGELPGDEVEALETRLLAEDDLFELTEAVEAEVLDDYSRGGLTAGQREQVERYLNASAEGRLRLAVVRGLAATPASGRLLPFPQRAALPAWARARALAALVVMGVGAALLASITIVPVQEKEAGKAIDKGLGPVAEATPSPTPAPVPTPPPPPIVFIATIALSNLRGEAQIPSFDVSGHADIVELRLTLPAGDEGYPSYRVVLNDAAEQEVATTEDLHAEPSSRQLALRMDADQLPAGRYALTVQGVTSGGDLEDLAYPEFEVHEP